MRVLNSIIFVCLCVISPCLHAEEEKPFLPATWSKGVHLFVGGGLNSSRYTSRTRNAEVGLGSNFKTELGYFFTERVAFEWGASVKFNRSEDLLIWDTMFTLGFRVQFPEWAKFKYRLGEPYARVFYGRAPTVVYLNGKQYSNYDGHVDRVQFDGPVWGLAIGSFYRTPGGKILYSELAATRHELSSEDGIVQEDDVPHVVFHNNTADGPVIMALYATIGVLAF